MGSRTQLLATGLMAALMGSLATAPMVGQTEPLNQTFEGKTEVVEVQVPVNVIGKDGTPIRGLTADAFTVLDGGEPQEIVDFRVVDLDVIAPDETRVEMIRDMPPVARRHFLLLFDLSFSQPSKIIRAREAAREFVLNELHPTDLVAVAMHTVEGGVRILVTFTPDRAQVARAIDTLGAPRLLQLARRDPLRFMIDDPGSSGIQNSLNLPTNDGGPSGALQRSVSGHLQAIANEMVKSENSFDRGRIFSWASSMGELARMLDTVQGRKHLVYLTEGFDGRLLFGRTPSADDAQFQRERAEAIFGQYWAVDTDNLYGHTGLQAYLAEMIETFRRSDCIIQMVDISGLSATTADISGVSTDTTAGKRQQDATRAALFYIANDTGGELFQDANDFGPALGSILDRSSLTYVLTIRPSDIEPDGSFHRLKVKADVPKGSRLNHRMGYYAPRPYEELHPLEKSLLASDAIAAATARRDIHVSVLTAPFKATPEQAYLPVIIEVDGQTLLSGNDENSLPVEFFAYASNQFGEMKDFFTQMVTIDISRDREQLESGGLKYYGHLDLGPGKYLVRVLVRNAVTGLTGVESVPVDVPSYAEAQPILLPPFFLESDTKWFLVRESLGQDNQQSVVYPFTVNGEPYIPAALPVLEARKKATLCLVAYNLGEGDIMVDGSIVAEDGSVVEDADLLLEQRTVTGIAGLDRFLATFRPDGLPAGNYTLRVALKSSGSEVLDTQSVPFALGVPN